MFPEYDIVDMAAMWARDPHNLAKNTIVKLGPDGTYVFEPDCPYNKRGLKILDEALTSLIDLGKLAYPDIIVAMIGLGRQYGKGESGITLH